MSKKTAEDYITEEQKIQVFLDACAKNSIGPESDAALMS